MTEPIRIQAEGPVVDPGGGETIKVPSGQEISLLDVIWNEQGPSGLAARFRFLAPGIARDAASVSFDEAAADMAHLCQDYALGRVSGMVVAPVQIIISLSDRPLPFGQSDPEATQFFEAYRVENGACIWEVF